MITDLEDHELLNQFTDTVRAMQRSEDYATISNTMFHRQKYQKKFAESLQKTRDEDRDKAFSLGNEILRRMKNG